MRADNQIFVPNWMGMILLLSGLGLAAFACHVVYKNLYPMVEWTETTGTVFDTVFEYDDTEHEFYEYEKAYFYDQDGARREVVSFTSSGKSDQGIAVEGEVIVFYNPEDPSQAMLFKWSNFLGVLMLPFGLFLVYFGWIMQHEKPDYRK
ncbi:DUF3592 domain-containing protein [Ekhidna sp.]|uniref:DUF3592 domain-containing protein n=1 Tax=Ekhidna sp. TaxID=2608089 RepID=UPI0032F07C73